MKIRKSVKTRKLKSFFTAVVCGVIFFQTAIPVSADPDISLDSEAAILMDAETGQILYAKNMNRQMYPASITKIMTGFLALTDLEPQQLLTVSQQAINAVPRTSSHISLEPGEILTVEEAMYALAMESANDAANVLAEAVGGSLEGFADRMNETAKALGACNSHFTNANGLPDEQHYTTAYDMALITAAAIKVPGFASYFNTLTYDCAGSRNFHNKNQMIAGPYNYDGVLMSKTGWTSSAQGTLVTAVKQGDTTLIAVVLKSVLLESKYQDTHKLLNYGFTHFLRKTVTGEEILTNLNLDEYTVQENQSFSLLLPADSSSDITFSLPTGLLSDSPDEIEVPVSAAIDGTPLPDLNLVLLRRAPEPEYPDVAAMITSAMETDIPETPNNSIKYLVAVLSAVPAVTLLSLQAHSRHQRRQRRNQLEKRIRRMKKMME